MSNIRYLSHAPRLSTLICRIGTVAAAVVLAILIIPASAMEREDSRYITRDQLRSQGGLDLNIGSRRIRLKDVRSLVSPNESCTLDVADLRSRLQQNPKQLEVECKGEICTVHTGQKGGPCAGEGRRCMIIFENLTAPLPQAPARP